MISTYLPVGWGGLWSAPCETYQREVEAGEGAGVAGEGGHHLAAGGGPDNDEAVLPAFPRVKGGIGTLWYLPERSAGWWVDWYGRVGRPPPGRWRRTRRWRGGPRRCRPPPAARSPSRRSSCTRGSGSVGSPPLLRQYDMNGIIQMQGGKNWILPKYRSIQTGSSGLCGEHLWVIHCIFDQILNLKKLLYHPRGPHTDKHLSPGPFTGQFLRKADIYGMAHLHSWGSMTWTGEFKCREVKTGFCRNRSIQTGSSGTLIGWKSGQTTYVPL